MWISLNAHTGKKDNQRILRKEHGKILTLIDQKEY